MAIELAVVLAVVVGATARGLVRTRWAGARLKRQLRGAGTYEIAKLGENRLGRVIGRALVHHSELAAPLTGRRCLYWVVEVTENDRHRSARTIIHEEQRVAFVLEDRTGRAVVDPDGAHVALDFDARSWSGLFEDPTTSGQAFLARHGVTDRGYPMRYREAIIEVGETIAVLGAGTLEPAPGAEAGYRDEPTRLRMASSPEHPLVISDAPSTTRR